MAMVQNIGVNIGTDTQQSEQMSVIFCSILSFNLLFLKKEGAVCEITILCLSAHPFLCPRNNFRTNLQIFMKTK
jgi:hypothetical protein